MIPLKSAKEIKVMKAGGKKLAWVMRQIKVKPGMNLKEIDSLAEKLIKKQGGKPSFKMVKGYHWASCLNVNQGVVHGVPTDYQLKEGDLLSLDIGMFYQGLHTDMARTIRVGKKEEDALYDAELGTGVAQRRHVDAEPEVDAVVGESLQHLDTVGGPEDRREGASRRVRVPHVIGASVFHGCLTPVSPRC